MQKNIWITVFGLLLSLSVWGQVPTLEVVPVVDEGPESQVQFQVQFVLSRPAENVASVTVETEGVTATAGEDFIPTTRTITFAPGEVTKSMTFDAVDDSRDEMKEEFFLVTISNADGLIPADPTTRLTIYDDDEEISISSNTPKKEGENATLTFTRNFPSKYPLEIQTTLESGSASRGEDFQAGDLSVHFAPEETSKSISISLIDDKKTEPTESFQANFEVTGQGFGDSSLSTDQMSMQIVDNDGNLALRFSSQNRLITDDGEMFFSYKTGIIPLERVQEGDHYYFESKMVTPKTKFIFPQAGQLASKGGDFRVVRVDVKKGEPFRAENLRVHYVWGENTPPQCDMMTAWKKCPWVGFYIFFHQDDRHPDGANIPGRNFIARNLQPGGVSDDGKAVEAVQTYQFQQEELTETTTIEILRISKESD